MRSFGILLLCVARTDSLEMRDAATMKRSSVERARFAFRSFHHKPFAQGWPAQRHSSVRGCQSVLRGPPYP